MIDALLPAKVLASVSACNAVNNVAHAISIFPFVGIQEVIVVIEVMNDATVIATDVLGFIAVFFHVWGLWKLKRSIGVQSNGDILPLLLKQGVLRFLLALQAKFWLSLKIRMRLFNPFILSGSPPIADFSLRLSSILLCEFTLDLRRRNTKNLNLVSNQSAIDLPTLSFRNNPIQSTRSVLGRFHENLMAEMGERNRLPGDVDGQTSEELDDDSYGMNIDEVELV
ncbi:hypothetical protein Clacol_001226 [Clathrus columnatus]|uniref:Uncharacterized protein n=1 Tax=Clathrus columnatus TaxID=1419009 RepID=A0AAV5A1C4_9AGAM|nr:hypothetical protein Clacol_001226 [Clathrus columnatus]